MMVGIPAQTPRKTGLKDWPDLSTPKAGGSPVAALVRLDRVQGQANRETAGVEEM